MNAKKLILAVGAVGLVAAAPAFADINRDSWGGGGGALTGNGSGELFFVAYDAARSETFVLDLNLSSANFMTNNGSLINNFNVTSSALQSWIAGSGNAGNIVWNLGAINNTSTTFGVLTTHGSAGATVSGTEVPPDGAALFVGINNADAFLAGVNATIGAGDSTLGTGNGTWLAGAWGTSFGGLLTFDNSSAGFANQMLMSFIYADPSNLLDGQPLVQTFANASWAVNALTGAVSYVGQQTAVPLPAAVWLFGSGLLGLAGVARRRS